MKAQAITTINSLFRCNLLRGKPSGLTERKFYFITIEIRLFTSQNRQGLFWDNPSQALEVIDHLLLFIEELALVIHMLPLATTTISKVLAYGRFPLWRILVKLHSDSLIESLFFLSNLYIYHIFRNSIFNKDNTPIRSMCDAFSLGSCVGNGNIF